MLHTPAFRFGIVATLASLILLAAYASRVQVECKWGASMPNYICGGLQ